LVYIIDSQIYILKAALLFWGAAYRQGRYVE
jgi:hypothetical protein